MDRQFTARALSDLDPSAARKLIDQRRIEAGREYVQGLLKLGFHPMVVCWMYSHSSKSVELAIVANAVERVGPLRVYDTLFRAYEGSILPQTIDPFEVSIYGPKSDLGTDLIDLMARTGPAFDLNGEALLTPIEAEVDHMIGINDPISIPDYAILYADRTLRSGLDALNWWRKFEVAVNARIAA